MTELVAAERNKQGAIETGQEPSPSSADSSRRVLVVVDEPCTSPERCASIRTDAGSGPTDALVIAPTHGAAATRWYVDEDAARADAAQRLRACVACLAGDGIRAEGRPGDSDPVQAITDALQVYAADEIQLITAPQRPSTWHHQNVIDRARGSFEQPIKHVVMPMQGETQARPRHIRPNHGPPPASAASPRHAARHSSLWKRFVARASRRPQPRRRSSRSDCVDLFSSRYGTGMPASMGIAWTRLSEYGSTPMRSRPASASVSCRKEVPR